MAKTLKSFSDLGISEITVGEIDWTIGEDCDGEHCWTMATGSVAVTVKLVERNTVVHTFFDVSQEGDFTYRACDEITAFEVDEENEDESEVLDNLTSKVEALDWTGIEEHLNDEHGQAAGNSASDALYDHADAEEYARDPYRYYGVSRRDFY